MTLQYLTPTSSVDVTYSPVHGSLAADIAYLQGTMIPGGNIIADDMTLLQSIYNAFAAHTHHVTDYSYVAYAPYPAYPTTFTTDISAPPTSVSPLSLTFTAGNDILAAEQLSLATSLNNIRVHTHSITDNILP